MNEHFELRLTGTDIPHRYRAMVPKLDGPQPAEETFELRSDSVELTMTLGALAHAAEGGEKPEQDLHVDSESASSACSLRERWGNCGRNTASRPGGTPCRWPCASTRRPPASSCASPGNTCTTASVSSPPTGAPRCTDCPGKPMGRSCPHCRSPAHAGGGRRTAGAERQRGTALPAGRRPDPFCHCPGPQGRESAPGVQPERLARGAEEQLREYRPHLLHFVGHGRVRRIRDSGLLLMESGDGHKREVLER